jgi:hypothetical protein
MIRFEGDYRKNLLCLNVMCESECWLNYNDTRLRFTLQVGTGSSAKTICK